MQTISRRDSAPAPLADDAAHILVVDDDARLRTLLDRFLTAEGVRVTTAADAGEARRKLAGFAFDAIVLDVMMPGEDGFALLKALRERLAIPVLMLTARNETDDRIRGLELGADDYLAKPFEPRELSLRLANLIKHSQSNRRTHEAVAFGGFVFDLKRDELTRDGEPVRLTDRERQLMRLFSEKPGETIPRHLLVAEGSSLGDRSVDVQINRLRRKLEDDAANPRYLQTMRGAGYRLLADPRDAV